MSFPPHETPHARAQILLPQIDATFNYLQGIDQNNAMIVGSMAICAYGISSGFNRPPKDLDIVVGPHTFSRLANDSTQLERHRRRLRFPPATPLPVSVLQVDIFSTFTNGRQTVLEGEQEFIENLPVPSESTYGIRFQPLDAIINHMLNNPSLPGQHYRTKTRDDLRSIYKHLRNNPKGSNEGIIPVSEEAATSTLALLRSWKGKRRRWLK